MGSVVGPLNPSIGFHGAGPLRDGFYPAGQNLQGLGKLQPGQVRAEAVVDAAAEGQDGRRRVAADVEAVGVVVDGRIAVGGKGIDEHHRSGREGDAGEFGVFGDDAQRAAGDRGVAHGLLDGAGRQLGVFGQQRPLVGMVDEDVDGCGELVAGGVGAREQQSGGEHAQFVGVEAVAVVLGPDEVGEQIVGQRVPPVGDHVVDVGVEFAPGVHDERFVDAVGIEGEGGEDVVGPQRELLPILARRAEQGADDRDGIGPGDVVDDVATAFGGNMIDEVVDDLDDGVVQARAGSRCEGLGHQAAQPAVRVALQAEQAVGEFVPQRSGGDALGHEVDAGRDVKTRVAQHRADHLVGEDLGAERTDRDGGLLLRGLDPRIDLGGGLGELVGQRRESGVEDVRAERVDSHVSQNVWPSSAKVNDLGGSIPFGHTKFLKRLAVAIRRRRYQRGRLSTSSPDPRRGSAPLSFPEQ